MKMPTMYWLEIEMLSYSEGRECGKDRLHVNYNPSPAIKGSQIVNV